MRPVVPFGLFFGLAALAGCQPPETTAPEDDGVLGVAASVTPGLHTLKAVHSGKCLEVTDGSEANGAKLRQAACDGSRRQQWNVKGFAGGVWEIRSAASGKCAPSLACRSRAAGAVPSDPRRVRA